MTLIKVNNRGQSADFTAEVLGKRNLIINGAMKVAQRGSQSNTNGLSSTACDRFRLAMSGGAVVTTTQDANVPNLSNGFRNSLKIDCTTADTSVAAGDYAILYQRIEGQDLQHLLYGTTAHKKVTVQFWVKSAKTGIHTVEISHLDAATYFNSQQYTISSADTWEKKTVTFVGYPTSSFDDDSNGSLQLAWWLLGGTTYSGGTHNSNTWHNTQANRCVGQVNVVDNTANNFYLTGVQMEVSDSASEFEHRSFEEELHACKRYYQKSFNYDTAPENGGGSGVSFNGGLLGYCGSNNSGTYSGFHRFDPEMRATPTVVTYGNSSGHWGRLSPTNTGTVSFSAGSGYISNTKASGINFGQNASGDTLLIGYGHITAEAEI